MPAKPPRFFPTLALGVLWVALYLVWIAVRPPSEATTATQTRGRAVTSTTTTITVPPLLKLKP